ncbi:MAG: PIG-L family deacetylase [Chloroflexota bacterium]|nr:PIG-L family deacetylase [Chloroflexota bacterium]
MADRLRLLCVVAHPDDESFGFGGTLARYAAEGVETFVICATRGQFGWPGDAGTNPGAEALGRVRAGELRAAGAVLGVREIQLLDHLDGHLARVSCAELQAEIARHIRRLRPQVVLTFGPDGDYGHPDHVAISQATTAAIVTAVAHDALPDEVPETLTRHRVDKLYYLALTVKQAQLARQVFGDPVVHTDGVARRYHFVGYEAWYHTARLDVWSLFDVRWQAGLCHQSQVAGFHLDNLTPEEKHRLWGQECYYRAMCFLDVDTGRETDLFAGLRDTAGLEA